MCLRVRVRLYVAAIISLIGVIIFGQQFYGDAEVSPFGWSFALTIFGLLIIAVNGAVLIVLTIMINIYVGQQRYHAGGRTRTLSTTLSGCIRACIPGL